MINRACVFSNRPYASQVEEQKFHGVDHDLCALKLTQKSTCLLSLRPRICGYSTKDCSISENLKS